MKRIALIVLVVWGIGATVAGAGPFRKRQATRAQAPHVVEYQTHCAGWASPKSPANADKPPLVWVLNGAGDLKGLSNALIVANEEAGEPVELMLFSWSHGYRKLLKDQIDTAHARQQGERLARAILDQKALEPGRRVIIVSHSAGCAVALAAGDALPMDAVDRILLLAPSVSTGYDVRPSIWAAREGLDVYCSKKDWVALGFVTRVVGTTDNPSSGAAAGRFGFRPQGTTALTSIEATRFRQHFWSPEVAWTGHTGGHHSMFATGYILNFLMPLMAGK